MMMTSHLGIVNVFSHAMRAQTRLCVTAPAHDAPLRDTIARHCHYEPRHAQHATPNVFSTCPCRRALSALSHLRVQHATAKVYLILRRSRAQSSLHLLGRNTTCHVQHVNRTSCVPFVGLRHRSTSPINLNHCSHPNVNKRQTPKYATTTTSNNQTAPATTTAT